MLKLWSEVPAARVREMVADVATWVWVSFWVVLGAKVHEVISSFAEAGRVLQAGGTNIQGAGAALGDALDRRPAGRPGDRRPHDRRVRHGRRAVHLRRPASSSRCSS